jgi:KaiC/GvpD/RAD55 family RecA-like ATPase
LPKASKRSSGIVGLDPVIEGGFPFSTVIVVTGSPVSGVEHFARQFWEAGEENGEKGTYLMIDGDVESGMTDAKHLPAENILPLLQGERVVVDSLSGLILKHGIDAAFICVTAAKKHCKSSGANVIFTYYTGLHSPVDNLRVMRTADVLIELKELFTANEIERQLSVHKIKGMAVPKRLIPYNITEKGIELSTTSRVV